MITGNLTGRISSTEADDELGRWNHVRIKGNQGIHVSIITAYRVCKTSISTTGPTTAFRQQYSILRARGIIQPNPRMQFLTDLQAFIQQLQDKGDRIMLLGDFNTDMDHPLESQALRNMLTELHLTDIMTFHHPTLTPVSTRHPGRRIDAIFTCPALTQRIKRCGKGVYGMFVDSDHRPLYLDIPATALLGQTPPELHTPNPQGIHSNNPQECSRYIFRLNQYLELHDVFNRTQKLSQWTNRFGLTARLI